MANHINRSKTPKQPLRPPFSPVTRSRFRSASCAFRFPVSSGEGEPMIAERHTLSDEEFAGL